MSDTTRRYYAEDRPSRGISLGTVLFGLILLAIGVLWLLDLVEILGITWTVVGSVLLMLVGVALLVGAREGSHGGMIFLGVVLSVVVLFGSAVATPSLSWGVGERNITPESISALEDSYELGVGSHTLDLREIEFPEGETEIAIRQGMGETVVYVPEDAAYQIDWSGGVGNAEVLDRQQSGVGLNGTYESEDYADQPVRVMLEIQVGIGSIEVRQ